MTNLYPELFFRHQQNPILTVADWPYPANTIFNPGATLLRDGTTLLLCRVEDRRVTPICAPLGRATVSAGGASTQCRH